VIDVAIKALADTITSGDYDNTQIGDISLEEKQSIIAALRFAGNRVGIDVEAGEKKK
jgi:hypothetical protein